MKISYLVNTYPRPSHTFIRREIRALERQGYEVHRFAMRSVRDSLVDPGDIEEDDRTEYILKQGAGGLARALMRNVMRNPGRAGRALAVAWRMGGRAGERLKHLIYLAEAALVAQRCDDEGIEHLHAHFGTNSATVACLTHLLGGPRWSFTTHGPEEFDAPEALSLGEKATRANFSVTVSSFGRSQLCRQVPLGRWPDLHVVHCGIEPALFPPPSAPPATLRLVAIGRFSEQKGLPLLIEAMALAVRDLPHLQLALVGDGPLRPEICAMIDRLGLGDHVELTGWLAEDEVRAQIAQSQALIMASFAEGLPMVVMEAMASGRPVIATSIAGLPELVTPDCGWLVPAGDPRALADAIGALARTTPGQLAEMSRLARIRVLERHDIDQEARKLAALITSAKG